MASTTLAAVEAPEAHPGLLFGFEPAIRVVPMPAWKRAIDIVGSSMALLLSSPVILAISIYIMLDSPGGPFYRQTRVGLGGQTFTCWKFRSMRRDAHKMLDSLMSMNEVDGPVFKMKDDPRRTRAGRFVRRTSIDEIPQLLNVLRGDMSLVGPRPPLVSEVLRYDEAHLQRLATTPGMTGLWQVTLRGRTHEFADMVALDVEYSERRSLLLDLAIMARTIPTVVFGRGSF